MGRPDWHVGEHPGAGHPSWAWPGAVLTGLGWLLVAKGLLPGPAMGAAISGVAAVVRGRRSRAASLGKKKCACQVEGTTIGTSNRGVKGRWETIPDETSSRVRPPCC